MTPAEFVALVQRNAGRVMEYALGHDGSGGKCDCIGLIIGAWRLGGQAWPWTHGSNYTARRLTSGLGYDRPLRMGDLVYKAREPGEDGYKLPTAYRDDPDQRDYYHVGVVTCEDPLEITHCTGVPGGIKIDTKRGKWHYSGQFSKLKEADPVSEKQMVVFADNGQPVNLRQGPGQKYTIVARVPVDATVTVVTDKDGWAFVRYGAKQGYMMDSFLQELPEEPVGGVLYERVVAIRALIAEVQAKLAEADRQLGGLL